jgi:hypothetical protein
MSEKTSILDCFDETSKNTLLDILISKKNENLISFLLNIKIFTIFN